MQIRYLQRSKLQKWPTNYHEYVSKLALKQKSLSIDSLSSYICLEGTHCFVETVKGKDEEDNRECKYASEATNSKVKINRRAFW